MLEPHGSYAKDLAYEVSLRVPLFMTGLGIEGGRVLDALVELIDVNSTICELANLSLEEVHNILELPPDIAQTFSRRLTKRFKGELWFR